MTCAGWKSASAMGPVLPAPDVAEVRLTEMTAATEPNIAVRKAAGWCLNAASGSGFLGKSDVLAGMHAYMHRDEYAVPGILGGLCPQMLTEERQALRVLLRYDCLLPEGIPPRIAGPYAGRLREALQRTSGDGWDHESVEALKDAMPVMAYSIGRVRSIMGPRDAAMIACVEDRARAVPSRFDVVGHAVMLCAARWSEGSQESVRRSLSDLRESAALDAVAVQSGVAPVRLVLRHGGCVMDGTLRFMEGLRALWRFVDKAAADVERTMLSPTPPAPSAVQSLTDLVRGYGLMASDETRHALWHLARSRRSPGLWG